MTAEGATEGPSVGHTLNAVGTGLDHLIKHVDDRGLEHLDDLSLTEFMHTFGGCGTGCRWSTIRLIVDAP